LQKYTHYCYVFATKPQEFINIGEHLHNKENHKMGRPINKKYFGADENDNIKVQFHNGTESVPGYILRERNSISWEVSDVDGNTDICILVDKPSANLLPGEMSITVKYDDETTAQITKLDSHLVTVNGAQYVWTFDTSLTDNEVQMEEAGTDDQLTDATDLEGDDIAYVLPPGMSLYEPYSGSIGASSTVPGASFVQTGAGSGLNASYSTMGTPYAPGGNVSTVSNSVAGLWREKYVGDAWSDSGNQSEFNIAWFADPTHGPLKGASADIYAGFGLRTNLTNENHYALMWKGYVQAPASGDFTLWSSTADDDAIAWIGTAALNPTYANRNAVVTSGDRLRSDNSVTLVAGQWYPIRMVFQEFGGDESFQLFLQDSTGHVVYGCSELSFAHNSVTKGY
jgi:hypothetical protein